MNQYSDGNLLIRKRDQRVGFMQGFVWKSSTALDFPRFSQFWYGPRELKQTIFRALHRSIQQTRSLPEHQCLQRYMFFHNLLSLISTILVAYSIYELVTEDQVSFLAIFSMVFPFFFYLVTQFGPIVEFFGRRRLRKSIIRIIEECNQQYLNRLGYRAEFPLTNTKCCLCITCCDFCIPKRDLSRLEIFQLLCSSEEEQKIS